MIPPFLLGALLATYWTDLPLIATHIVAFALGVVFTAAGALIIALPPDDF